MPTFSFIEEFSLFVLYILRDWWWIFAPPVLLRFAWKLYLWYKQERFFGRVPWVMLEVRLPKEVEKTPKAMESVLTGLHAIYDPPTWRDRWFEGRTLLWSFSLEIVSIDGVVHFYVFIPKAFRNVVETNIYSEYPEAEITEAEDYTKRIPQDIPNKNWDLWGSDLVLQNNLKMPGISKTTSIFPLRTYTYYESELTAEEKRVDPLSSMLELMSSLKEGEQLWIQILLRPIVDEKVGEKQIELKKEVDAFVDHIMGKEEKKGKSGEPGLGSLIGEFFEVVGGGLTGMGPPPPPPQEKRLDPLLWRLSPGQQELAKAVEAKVLKPYFHTNVRFIYLGKNEVFARAKGVAGTFGIFKQFNGYNTLSRPDKVTKTKVVFFLVNRRNTYRKKRLLRFYARRWFPRHRKPYVLNTEEVATIYHFPGRMVAPAPFVPRIIAKKGEPPPVLPTG